MAAIPRPAIRRPISILLTVFAFLIIVALTPVAVPLLAVADVVTGSRLRRVRTWCLVVGIFTVEVAGLIAGAALLLWYARRLDGDLAQYRFHRLERWWACSHVANLRRFAGLRWLVENPEELERGNAIVLSRHASHADAVLPVLLFAYGGDLRLLYTLKDGLQWAPAMDIVGNRLPNVFVDRSPPPDSPIAARIETLAHRIDDEHVAVIFPEGTFFTPEGLDRAARRIAETHPELEAEVRKLEHLLPPRPAGTIALLRGAPDADLVLVGHEGMEAFSDIASIRRNLPLREPVRVRLWRIARSEVPTDEDAFVTWLLDRWIEMDRWIQNRLVERREADLANDVGRSSRLVGARELRP